MLVFITCIGIYYLVGIYSLWGYLLPEVKVVGGGVLAEGGGDVEGVAVQSVHRNVRGPHLTN